MVGGITRLKNCLAIRYFVGSTGRHWAESATAPDVIKLSVNIHDRPTSAKEFPEKNPLIFINFVQIGKEIVPGMKGMFQFQAD